MACNSKTLPIDQNIDIWDPRTQVHRYWYRKVPHKCFTNVDDSQITSASLYDQNDSKTEYILITPQWPHQLAKCSQIPITIGDSVIPPSNHVRNLGAYFDKHLSMEQHIKIKCQAAQFYNISKIRKYLDESSARILIRALVQSSGLLQQSSDRLTFQSWSQSPVSTEFCSSGAPVKSLKANIAT